MSVTSPCSEVTVNSLNWNASFLAALILSLFIRDNDVKCVGFTNKICAAACDPCRKLAVPEAPDVDLDDLRISDASSAAWAK